MLDVFDRFRGSEHAMRRVPSIAEMLSALMLLRRYKAPLPTRIADDPALANSLLCTLLKDRSDLELGQRILGEWMGESPGPA